MAYKNPTCIGNLVTDADLSSSQFYIVKITDDSTVGLCDSAGEKAFGILQNKPEKGYAASVAVQGLSKVLIGTGGLTTGAQFQTDGSGTAIDATSGDVPLGQVVEGGSAGEYGVVAMNVGTGVALA